MVEQRLPAVSLIEEDPVQAMRNAVHRIRAAKLRAVERSGDHAALMAMDSVVEEELAVVEQALCRLEPS